MIRHIFESLCYLGVGSLLAGPALTLQATRILCREHGLTRIPRYGPSAAVSIVPPISLLSSTGTATGMSISSMAVLPRGQKKGYPLSSQHFGEIKVLKYDKALKEEYETRQFD
jgi:hypothetical protein